MFKSMLVLAVTALAVGTAATLPATAPATTGLQPEAIEHAREIRADVNARYRMAPGRKLAVTEASTTGVVDSLTLLTDPFDEPLVVPAENGVYFAICAVRGKCPYPARSASWPVTAFLPRRQALELAVRTFVETSASLVVVALPTARPVWLVFERASFLATVDAHALRALLAADPTIADTALRVVVDQVTLGSLFAPGPIYSTSPATETLFAVSLSAPWSKAP
jgi:hypothetical protein